MAWEVNERAGVHMDITTLIPTHIHAHTHASYATFICSAITDLQGTCRHITLKNEPLDDASFDADKLMSPPFRSDSRASALISTSSDESGKRKDFPEQFEYRCALLCSSKKAFRSASVLV